MIVTLKNARTMKTKNRIELASHAVFNKLPKWKQEAIKEDRQTKNYDSRVMQEFAYDVSKLVESDQEIFVTTE